jgi:hypothetical protein
MSANKYEFTGETKDRFCRTLHRIRACRSFGNVNAGDIGGWIEKEENLDHDGTCWVSDNACVFDTAHVFGNAQVSNKAMVFHDARVFDDAQVSEAALVFDKASVYNRAKVFGRAWVGDSSAVCESARVCGRAWISGRSMVYGDAWVYGKANIRGEAEVCGEARIQRTNHYLCISPIGRRLDMITFFRATNVNKIHVNSYWFRGDIDAFARAVQATYGNNYHAKAYTAAIELAKTQIDLSVEK